MRGTGSGGQRLCHRPSWLAWSASRFTIASDPSTGFQRFDAAFIRPPTCLANADDLSDYRPGRRALEELGVRSPLLEAGLGKAGIREVSRRAGLPTAEKPSYACLASRFPYGESITREGLAIVDAAEAALRGMGFARVRVRHHGDVARVEFDPDDMPAAFEKRAAISDAVERAGFAHVALDLEGYRTGSMNEVLP
ncbi:MAG: ATP-dependent sacrificial sulfur transferase LarE [Planctomycetota bacterium]|jgi:uncharacterized protein